MSGDSVSRVVVAIEALRIIWNGVVGSIILATLLYGSFVAVVILSFAAGKFVAAVTPSWVFIYGGLIMFAGVTFAVLALLVWDVWLRARKQARQATEDTGGGQ